MKYQIAQARNNKSTIWFGRKEPLNADQSSMPIQADSVVKDMGTPQSGSLRGHGADKAWVRGAFV